MVEKAYGLHSVYKIKRDCSKKVFRTSLKALLPCSVIGRMDKKGFLTPFSIWIKNEPRDYIQDTIMQKQISSMGYFDRIYILNLVNEHQNNHCDHSWVI